MKSKSLMIFAAAMLFANLSHSSTVCLNKMGVTSLNSACTDQETTVQYVRTFIIRASGGGGYLRYDTSDRRVSYLYVCRKGANQHYWFANHDSITAGSVKIFASVSRPNGLISNNYWHDLEYNQGGQDRINTPAPIDTVETGSFAVLTSTGVTTINTRITQIGDACKVDIISNATDANSLVHQY